MQPWPLWLEALGPDPDLTGLSDFGQGTMSEFEEDMRKDGAEEE